MSGFVTCSLTQNPVAYAASGRFTGEGCHGLIIPCSQIQRAQINSLSFTVKVYAKATLRSVRCRATQTQSTQQKSSTATIQRSYPRGKLKAPKLDDGSGGFPPFRFGKGGGGGSGGAGAAIILVGFFFLPAFCCWIM